MKTTSLTLIVMPPHSPGVGKVRLSCKLGAILVAAFLLAFLTTTFFLLMFPPVRVNESNRVRLAAENQTLRNENKNLVLQIRKLDSRLSRVGEHSEQVAALIRAD